MWIMRVHVTLYLSIKRYQNGYSTFRSFKAAIYNA